MNQKLSNIALARTAAGILALAAGTAQAQSLSPAGTFPGDAALHLATGVQDAAAIAAGGPGYLVVWEDQRAVLSGFTSSPSSTNSGNGIDIYGAVLDTNGAVLVGPIVISNQGKDQTDPQVAWNGQDWLVIWESQRPDWYFFQDIYGARVSPQGVVLDPVPLSIRPELTEFNGNDHGEDPTVTSDGTNWFVAWRAIDLAENKLILQGTRVAPDGTLLDPSYPTLYKHNSLVFGPSFPVAASVGGEYLLVWDDFGDVLARRLAGDLQPLGPAFQVDASGARPQVASNGSQYFVVSRFQGFRIAADGTLLDPAGITIPEASSNLAGFPDAAWTGSSWAVTYAESLTGSIFDDLDVWTVRIAPDGTLIDTAPILTEGSATSDSGPVLAGDGQGGIAIAFQSGPQAGQAWGDVRFVGVAANGSPTASSDVGNGFARQEHLVWVTGNGVHMAVYTSRNSGTSRILTQRFDDDGNAIDAEPVLVHQGFEAVPYAPGAAWNGTHYLVAWRETNGAILGRRLTAGNQVIGFGDTLLLSQSSGRPAVASLAGDFLVTSTYQVSNDQSYLQAIHVNGATGFPDAGGPATIAFDFALDPEIVAFGGKYLVTWASKPCHDCPGSTLFGRRLLADGSPSGGSFVIDGNGYALSPAVAVAGDQALVVWSDGADYGQDDVQGRFLLADGALAPGEFTIGSAPSYQLYPSVAFDGEDYVVSWADYRHVKGVEQLRGEIYATRVTVAGQVLDPGGVQLTDTENPEDFPANASGGAGQTLIAYLALGGAGGVAEVQRMTFRVFDNNGFTCQEDLGFAGPGTASLSVCGDPLSAGGTADLVITSALPGAPAFLAMGSSFAPTPILGGTFVPVPPLFVLSLATDGSGELLLPGIPGGIGPLVLYAQAALLDLAQPQAFQITNAVKLDFLP